MKKHELHNKLNELDKLPLPEREKTLAACRARLASTKPAPSPSRRPLLRSRIVLCAVLTILVSACSICAAAAEARNYQRAVTFFDAYALPTEGLTRGEIKQVWRDITTGSFTSPATAALLEQSVQRGEINGYAITLDAPTPAELELLWNSRNAAFPPAGVSYQIGEEYEEDKQGGSRFERALLEQYRDGTLRWTAEFREFYLTGFAECGSYVAVWGNTPSRLREERQYACLALVDAVNGEICWTLTLDNGFRHESIEAVLADAGGIVTFSRGDLKTVCVSRYSLDGSRVSFAQTEVGNYGIWGAARLGDGYLLQLGSYTEGERARIVRVSPDGELGEVITYDSDDSSYYITDMLAYGGKVYLSTYATPKYEEGRGRDELAPILNPIFDAKNFGISREELTALVQANYTAVLLVCDPSTGTPELFYSVAGALGGALRDGEDGSLVWEVEQVADTYLSLYTSSFTIGGSSLLYRYTFDEVGTLLTQIKTDETRIFRK